MHVLVNRFVSDLHSTLSRIYVDETLACYGLEDPWQPTKIPGQTRIPAGTYEVGVHYYSQRFSSYSETFQDIGHQGMLHVLKVPNFEWILIHCGNTHKHTEGCLLVGKANSYTPPLQVASSRETYRELYPRLIVPARAGELTITYVDNDREPASGPR